MLSSAAFQYQELAHKFEEIMRETHVEIIEAKAELTASMNKILA